MLDACGSGGCGRGELSGWMMEAEDRLCWSGGWTGDVVLGLRWMSACVVVSLQVRQLGGCVDFMKLERSARLYIVYGREARLK